MALRSITFERLVSDVDFSAKVGYAAKRGTGWALGSENDCTGIIMDGGAATGDYVTVGQGEQLAVAGGTIAVGDPVSSDSAGKIQKAVSGDTPVGWALSAGTSGKLVRINFLGYADEAVA